MVMARACSYIAAIAAWSTAESADGHNPWEVVVGIWLLFRIEITRVDGEDFLGPQL